VTNFGTKDKGVRERRFGDVKLTWELNWHRSSCVARLLESYKEKNTTCKSGLLSAFT
jgi:hypothetical protein